MATASQSEDAEQDLEFIRHELHDGACQYVAAAMAMLEAFCQKNGHAIGDDSDDLTVAMKFLGNASKELRRLVRGLPPIHLDGSGVLKSVENAIAERQTAGAPEIEFCHDGEFSPLPKRWQVAILRIVQECLSNACRHSRSQHILVGMVQDQDRIGIQVQDWGIGFDPAKVENRGDGLSSIRHRAESLGGSVMLDASPGNGTCVMVEMPLPG